MLEGGHKQKDIAEILNRDQGQSRERLKETEDEAQKTAGHTTVDIKRLSPETKAMSGGKYSKYQGKKKLTRMKN